MNWDNYGETKDKSKKNAWHIDHIIPCAAFNMTDPIHQKACFHYTNLQPLWWHENIRKLNKFDLKEKDDYLKQFVENYSR
jgi:hypothetical protein